VERLILRLIRLKRRAAMRKKYIVQLTEEEREQLHKLISSGTAPARKLNRARILLKADVGKHAKGEALIDREIARMLETSPATVQRVRELLVTREDSRPRWNARCLIGSTSALWTGAPKLT
jgi:hypothetical protein